MENIEKIQKVGLFLKHSQDDDAEIRRVAKKIGEYLAARFGTFAVCKEDEAVFKNAPVEAIETDKIAGHCDLIVIVGGDGTLLRVSRTCVEHGTPVVGVNLGRLGFLVEITPDNFSAQLEEIFSGQYKLEERVMLEASHVREDKCLARFVTCNDVAIRNKDTVRMIELNTSVDGTFLNTIWSDGLIVATPTGSTAYALSSGGPLLEPTMEATLLVPICPHTLSHRPLVVDWHKVIEVTVSGKHYSAAVVAIDGQLTRDLLPSDRLIIKPLKDKLKLIQPINHNYFDTLRNKLKWSEKL